MHRRADIFAASQILREAGFRNVSMDLIAGLAQQTRESWEESVARILEIRPEHISIYLLEIDEGSRLGKESLAGGSRYSAESIPSDDAMAESYESACACLADSRIRTLRNLQLGSARLPLAPQFEILAPRTVHRPRRRRAFLRWRTPLVKHPRFCEICRVHRRRQSRRANRSNRSRRNKRSTKNYFSACANSKALTSPASKKSTASACNRASPALREQGLLEMDGALCASRQRI